MDMDTYGVQDLIQEKGIWENSMDLLIEAMNSNYVNPLRMRRQLPAYGQNPY